MRNEVIVNGILLTRTQVQEALDKLNAPERGQLFQRGDVIAKVGDPEQQYLVLRVVPGAYHTYTTLDLDRRPGKGQYVGREWAAHTGDGYTKVDTIKLD